MIFKRNSCAHSRQTGTLIERELCALRVREPGELRSEWRAPAGVLHATVIGQRSTMSDWRRAEAGPPPILAFARQKVSSQQFKAPLARLAPAASGATITSAWWSHAWNSAAATKKDRVWNESSDDRRQAPLTF